MTLVSYLKKCLLAPPVTGGWALIGAIAALVLPTFTRLQLDGTVQGIAFPPFSPFVLLSAILLGWRYGVVVALGSAAIADALFVGPRFELFEGPSDLFGDFAFLVTSTLIIGLVQAIRSLLRDWLRPGGPGASAAGVIFSLDRGEAWVSWYGATSPVRLGPRDEVAAMMQDFLAQVELGQRLTGEAG